MLGELQKEHYRARLAAEAAKDAQLLGEGQEEQPLDLFTLHTANYAILISVMFFFPFRPFCIAIALWQQEQSRVAKQHNALVRQKSSEALAERGREEEGGSSLVRHHFVDTSGLADDKYAIAESILEAERESCPNWMQTKHLQFERDHGQLMQLEEDCESDAEDDLDGETQFCQCPIDLCARDAERLDHYQTWFCQCREVLRVCRNSRKAKGFVLDHPMIVVSPPDVKGTHDLKCGDEVYLLAKVAFSPFDATLVKLKLERLGPDSLVAKMHPTNEGLPDVISFDLFLKQCCETFDGESDKIMILHYSGGRKFGELDIQSMECIEQAAQRVAPEVVALDPDLVEEQRSAKKRADLLKRALAVDSTSKTAKAKPKTGPKPGPRPQPKAVKKTRKQSHPEEEEEDPGEPDELGLAGEMGRSIEREWHAALQTDQPQQPQAASSSGSSGSRDPPAQPVQQPAVDPTLPWKDPQGYCFLPKDGKEKGIHLGSQLSMLNCTECMDFVPD
eukprot:s158_g24.t1